MMDEVLPPPSKPPSIPPTTNVEQRPHNTRWRDVLVDYGNLMVLVVGLVTLLSSLTFFGGKALYTISVEVAIIGARVEHLERLAEGHTKSIDRLTELQQKQNEKINEKLEELSGQFMAFRLHQMGATAGIPTAPPAAMP